MSEAAGLSPGNETIKRAIRLNGKRDKKSERAKTKQHKKRRIKLKKERSAKSTGVEMREGRTYESEIGKSHCIFFNQNFYPALFLNFIQALIKMA